jgi:hypothetical protein
MLDLATAPEPPLHFIAGAHALAGARTKIDRLTADVDDWESLTRSVDRP